jgi:hypothetical protein
MTEARPGRIGPGLVKPFLLVLPLALAPRLMVALTAPTAEGDGRIYLRVAENILRNGCVSLSPPLGGDCVPHWGGNQFPGYPAFIALLEGAFGAAVAVVPIAQALIVAACLAYCVACLARMSKQRAAVLLAAGLLVVSPATLASQPAAQGYPGGAARGRGRLRSP